MNRRGLGHPSSVAPLVGYGHARRFVGIFRCLAPTRELDRVGQQLQAGPRLVRSIDPRSGLEPAVAVDSCAALDMLGKRLGPLPEDRDPHPRRFVLPLT